MLLQIVKAFFINYYYISYSGESILPSFTGTVFFSGIVFTLPLMYITFASSEALDVIVIDFVNGPGLPCVLYVTNILPS